MTFIPSRAMQLSFECGTRQRAFLACDSDVVAIGHWQQHKWLRCQRAEPEYTATARNIAPLENQ